MTTESGSPTTALADSESDEIYYRPRPFKFANRAPVPQDVCSADMFIELFLPQAPPAEMNHLKAKYDNFLEQLKLGSCTQEDSKGMYYGGPLCVLLSEMSLQIPDDPLLLEEKDHRWLFFDHSPHWRSVENTYTVDQFGHKPDIVALQVPEEQVRKHVANPDKDLGLRDKLYWTSFGMIGKIKPGKYTSETGNRAKEYARVYCNSTARFQPHRGGLLNFIAFHDRFVLSWFSLDLVVFSEPIPWSEGFPYFSRLVTQIHLPSESHPYIWLPDPALRLVTNLETEHEEPQLYLTLHVPANSNTKKEFALTTLFNRRGYGRKAFIALATPTTASFTESDIRVVRFHWENSERCFKEPEILNAIHQPYPVPGVVQPDMELTKAYSTIPTNFPDYISERSQSRSGTKQRERHLLVTKTLGKSLSSCSSIKGFLKVMYDAPEVSRFLWEKKDIMHRDISWGNVRVAFRESEHAQHISETPEMEGCRFIDQVLDVPDPRVHCLLADFELATHVDLRSDLNSPHNLKEGRDRDIMGTPMFIATDRSSPRAFPRIFDNWSLKYMLEAPRIPNRTNDELITKFWEALPGLAEVVQHKLRGDDLNVDHRPIHEAESLFWVLVLFFIRARPKNVDGGDNLESDRTTTTTRRRRTRDSDLAYKAMATNKLGPHGNSRLLLLMQPPWEDAVHPKLAAFVPMLLALSFYFAVTWHAYDIPPGSDSELHAHEAMQRFIFGCIRDLGDVELDAENPRDIFLDADLFEKSGSTGTRLDHHGVPVENFKSDSDEIPVQGETPTRSAANANGGPWQVPVVVQEIVKWSVIEKLWFSCKTSS